MQGGNRHAEFGDFDLVDLAQSMWRRRLIIIACAIAAIAAAIIYLQYVTYRYTAELKVTPTQSAGEEPAGRLSGIAKIAGLDIAGGQGELQFQLYLEALQSREIANKLSESPYIMRNAFRGAWDPDAQRWRRPDGPVQSIIAGLKSVLGLPVYDWRPPDGAALQALIKSEVTISDAGDKPIVTITFQHPDQKFASDFLRLLDEAADNQLRERSLRRSAAYIQYLYRKLGTVTLAEHREALARNLSEQERIRMIASANLPFAAETFGPPSVTSLPNTPRPAAILAGAAIGGAALGLLVAFMVAYQEYRRSRRSDAFELAA